MLLGISARAFTDSEISLLPRRFADGDCKRDRLLLLICVQCWRRLRGSGASYQGHATHLTPKAARASLPPH